MQEMAEIKSDGSYLSAWAGVFNSSLQGFCVQHYLDRMLKSKQRYCITLLIGVGVTFIGPVRPYVM
jgi:hypothetical protein